MKPAAFLAGGLLALLAAATAAAEEPNLHTLPSVLEVPALSPGEPAGRRVKQTAPGHEGWQLFHTLYLPANWQPPSPGRRSWPVIVEYPGNGGYRNSLGDVCTGWPEDCKLGFGLSNVQDVIWICLPFVDPATKKHATNWWGDADSTAKYCVQAVRRVCDGYGGDDRGVVLTGFSRGAIACNYIGLRNDEIAGLWCALAPHSHYDGVRRWPYADSDIASAQDRLKRLGERPQLVSHELSIDAQREFLKQHAPAGKFTFLALPFANHSDQWVLKDIPERQQARGWLAEVVRPRSPLPLGEG